MAKLFFHSLFSLQSIEHAYDIRQSWIADNAPYVIQHLTFSIGYILIPARDRLTVAKKFNDKVLDGIAALNLLISALEGPQTNERLVIGQLAFCIVQQLVSPLLPFFPSPIMFDWSELLST